VTVALLHLRVSEMSPAQQSLFVCSAQFTETVAALAVVNTVVKKFRCELLAATRPLCLA
jgi:hypothetical protein